MDTAQFNNLSRRVGTQWALAAAQSQPCSGWGGCDGAQRPAERCTGCLHDFKPSPAKAYKPAHGGYPG